jgi:hypothetical protein
MVNYERAKALLRGFPQDEGYRRVLLCPSRHGMTVDEQLGRTRQRLRELQAERDRIVAAARAVVDAWPQPPGVLPVWRLRDELEAVGALPADGRPPASPPGPSLGAG